jgi:hypothetical protein
VIAQIEKRPELLRRENFRRGAAGDLQHRPDGAGENRAGGEFPIGEFLQRDDLRLNRAG